MTPEETIRDAWERCPSDWPGRREGLPYRMVARELLSVQVNLFPDAPTKPVPFYPVEFLWERGRFKGQLVWRVIGKWRATEITVVHGLLQGGDEG